MNKFKFYFFLFCSVLILFSCNKSDDSTSVPIRDFDEQYAADMEIIEDYLNTHYLELSPDQGDVTIRKVDAGQTAIGTVAVDPNSNSPYPRLLKKSFEYNDKTYQIYYIKLRPDNTSVNAMNPSRVDGILAAYKGTYLKYNTTKEPVLDGDNNPVLDNLGNPVTQDVTELITVGFEDVPFPSAIQFLDGSIRGWSEILPFFKSGNKQDIVVGEPLSYNDFGAGIIFIPSGFAYFNLGKTSALSGITIPSYSPLVFSFKLNEVIIADQDEDGIPSNDEDLNGDGFFDTDNDDTDGDGIANLYDVDDDGDGYNTIYEIHKDNDGNIIFEDNDNDGIPNYLDSDDPN